MLVGTVSIYSLLKLSVFKYLTWTLQEVLHEVSKNNSAVASINTTANKIIARSDKTAATNLRERIKKFNTDWTELKTLLNKKQQEVLKLQSEIKTFDRAIDRETERIGEIQKDVQACYQSVGKDDVIMEKSLEVNIRKENAKYLQRRHFYLLSIF